MAHHPDFLVYFALPHVHEPERHPSFQHLLDPQCMTAQRAQLEIFLSMLPRQDKKPRLYAMMQAGGSTRHTERVQTERECSTQVKTVAQKDLQRLLKGEADIEEFVEPTGQGGATQVVATKPIAPQDPPFNTSEQSSPAHAQNQGLKNEDCPQDTAEDPSAAECEQNNEQATTPVSDAAGAEQQMEDHAPEAQVPTDLGTVEADTEKLVTDRNEALEGSDQPQEPQGNATEIEASENQDSPPLDRVDRPANATAVQAAENSPAGSPTGEGAAPQLDPVCDVEEPAVCNSVDLTQMSARRGRNASEAAVSKVETVTRTSLQQAQLPPLDWDKLKEHLTSRDTGFQARLLQVCSLTRWPGHRQDYLGTLGSFSLAEIVYPACDAAPNAGNQMETDKSTSWSRQAENTYYVRAT